jgi:hypothetical protein
MTWSAALAIFLMYLVSQYLDRRLNLRVQRVRFVRSRIFQIRCGWRSSWRR